MTCGRRPIQDLLEWKSEEGNLERKNPRPFVGAGFPQLLRDDVNMLVICPTCQILCRTDEPATFSQVPFRQSE
jgi:hypothetical protein